MTIDLDDLRRQYANLNDDALLAIHREELTPVAQQVWDAEVSSRGLKQDAGEEDREGEAGAVADPMANWTEVATFDNPGEANVARSLLRLADIPSVLSTDMPLAGSVFATVSEVSLFVPAEYKDQAEEVLNSEISEEELAAQAEAAADGEEEIEGSEEAEEAESEE